MWRSVTSSVLGMEPIEPTREELERYTETEFSRASSEKRTDTFNNATSDLQALAREFITTWLELDAMKRNVLKLTESDIQGNQIFKQVHDAILKGTFDENMKALVSKYWASIFTQYRKTIAPPISGQAYMLMMNNSNTPLGQVASAYNRKLIPLLIRILKTINRMK